jgi:rSAM/selenodomain-associated transferase 2
MADREPVVTDGATRSRNGSDDALAVAIVVPVLNEAAGIVAALRRLRRDFPDCELVVVDGGSSDATAAFAAGHARVLHSPPGRAVQMNAGAAATSAPVLWFIHADCEIDPRALGQVRAALADPGVVGGGLTLRFDRRSLGLDYLAWSSTKRARHLHQIFGDQAMFVRRDAFEGLGGFPEIAIMEDLELSRRLARRGRLVVLHATSTASSRRLVTHGTWSMIVFMQVLKACYFLGVAPETIARLYRAGPPWTHVPAWSRLLRRGPRTTGPSIARLGGQGAPAPRGLAEPARPGPAGTDRAHASTMPRRPGPRTRDPHLPVLKRSQP